MKSVSEFDKALAELNQELDAMSGEEFFAMFGLSLNDLPPDLSESQGQKSKEMRTNCKGH